MKLGFVDSDRVIYQSANLTAIFCPVSGNPRNRLVVAFMAITENDEVRTGLSRETMRSRGMPAIHIMCEHNHWYQHAEMPEMLDVIRRFGEAYGEVVTYGVSMGAFAALQSSKALRAKRTVAFAPQFTVDKSKVDFNPGWGQFVQDVKFVWDDFENNVSPTAEHYVVYDPLFTDNLHFREIAKRVPVIPVRVPFGGHHVWLTYGHAGLGAQGFIDMIHGTYDVAASRRTMRACRANDPRYWSLMAENAPRWRQSALRHGVALDANDPNVQEMVRKFAT